MYVGHNVLCTENNVDIEFRYPLRRAYHWQ